LQTEHIADENIEQLGSHCPVFELVEQQIPFISEKFVAQAEHVISEKVKQFKSHFPEEEETGQHTDLTTE
jgi:cytochrome c556